MSVREGAKPPLFVSLPLPFVREGGRGIGLINSLIVVSRAAADKEAQSEDEYRS